MTRNAELRRLHLRSGSGRYDFGGHDPSKNLVQGEAAELTVVAPLGDPV